MSEAICFCLPALTGGAWMIVFILARIELRLLRIAHALEKRNFRDR